MQRTSCSPLVTGQMTNFEAQALTLDDPRPIPTRTHCPNSATP